MIVVFIWSVLLYACESWYLTEDDRPIHRLEAVEMRIWRKIENISWKDHVPNETVLQRMRKRHLINTIRERKAIWIGHALRGDTLVKVIWKEGSKERSEVGDHDAEH